MKKHYILIILFFVNLSIVSQNWKEFTIEQALDANPKNELSEYFKKEIPRKLLRKVKYNSKLNNITLSFFINKENKPFDLKINAFGNTKLRESIFKAFKKYPLENLQLDKIRKNKRYFFQIISQKRRKNFINCSNKIFSSTLPIADTCNDLEYFKDIKICTEKKIKKHLLENIDFSIVNQFKLRQLIINLDLLVDTNGQLNIKKYKGINILQQTIESAVASFPKFQKPATLNDEKSTWSLAIKYNFNKNNLPTFKENKINNDSIFVRNSTNDFAVYLKTKITDEDLEKSNLTRVNKSLNIRFELDKKNKPFNISTTSRSDYLNDKIIKSFKEYDIDKLNFFNKNAFNSYGIQILSFEDNKAIIKTNEIISSETAPIFPGCEKSSSLKEAKKCFSKGVQMHFSRKFDADLPNRLGLSPGRKRVFIGFTINKEGYVSDIVAKAPHKKIEEEVINVMNSLPKIKPAMQGNQNVNIKFSIPFTLIVEKRVFKRN